MSSTTYFWINTKNIQLETGKSFFKKLEFFEIPYVKITTFEVKNNTIEIFKASFDIMRDNILREILGQHKVYEFSV
jgi:hypothetical protein